MPHFYLVWLAWMVPELVRETWITSAGSVCVSGVLWKETLKRESAGIARSGSERSGSI